MGTSTISMAMVNMFNSKLWVYQSPYAPCMVYLPTFGWFLGQMLVNIPYMEHMGEGNSWPSCCLTICAIHRAGKIHLVVVPQCTRDPWCNPQMAPLSREVIAKIFKGNSGYLQIEQRHLKIYRKKRTLDKIWQLRPRDSSRSSRKLPETKPPTLQVSWHKNAAQNELSPRFLAQEHQVQSFGGLFPGHIPRELSAIQVLPPPARWMGWRVSWKRYALKIWMTGGSPMTDRKHRKPPHIGDENPRTHPRKCLAAQDVSSRKSYAQKLTRWSQPMEAIASESYETLCCGNGSFTNDLPVQRLPIPGTDGPRWPLASQWISGTSQPNPPKHWFRYPAKM